MEKLIRVNKRKKERGYTLLEYCAGAAVMAGMVYAAMSAFGTNLQTYFDNLGRWVVNNSDPGNVGGGSGGNSSS